MGQNASTPSDWRFLILRLKEQDVADDDESFWKPLFLTSLTGDDIGAFLAPPDVRELRRARPASLARLLYRCMAQLATFVNPATAAVDTTSALNAIRIIAAVMPVVFEPDAPEPPMWPPVPAGAPAGAVAARNRSQPPPPGPTSPFCADFWRRVFLENSRCLEADPTAVFPPLLPPAAAAAGFAGGAGANTPGSGTLAAQLMRLLVRAAFVPGFTIGSRQPATDTPRARETTVTYRLGVRRDAGASGGLRIGSTDAGVVPAVAAADDGPVAAVAAAPNTSDPHAAAPPPVSVTTAQLWMSGVFADQTSSLNYSNDTTAHRIELLRCLVACVTLPLFGTDALACETPFLAVLVDPVVCPEAGTLVASLLNVLVTHNAKGVLPFTSHYFAERGECVLALSLQLLGLMLHDDPLVGETSSAADNDLSNRGSERGLLRPLPPTTAWILAALCDATVVGGGAAPPTSAGGGPGGEGWSAARRGALVQLALQRLAENPLASATTALRNSQRFVPCFVEGLVVLWKLARLPSFRAAAACPSMLMPLLFFLQEVRLDYAFFGAAQLATFLVLALSTEPAFLAALAAPLFPAHAGSASAATKALRTPLQSLPPLPGDATAADALVLSVCAFLSPAAPRWCASFLPGLAVVLCNVAPYLARLSEVTCFEWHHALDYAASTKALLPRAPNAIASPPQAQPAAAARKAAADASAVEGADVDGDGDPATAGRRGVACLVLEAAVQLLQHHARAAAPLAASVGSTDIPARLRGALLPNRGAAAAAAAANTADSATTGVGEKGRTAALLAALDGFGARARDVLSAHPSASASGRSTAAAAAADAVAAPAPQEMYALLAHAAAPAGPFGVDVVTRRFELTDEALRWTDAYLWGLVHKHNVRPPLFDAERVRLFRLK